MADENTPVVRPGAQVLEGESVTKPYFADQVDVNRIVRNHARTGVWDHVASREPMYGDQTLARDLTAAMLLVEKAQAEFMTLPAAIRKAADHRAEVFAEMLSTPEGTQALVDAGLPVNGVSPTPQPEAVPPSQPPTPAEAGVGINPGRENAPTDGGDPS